MSLRLWKFLQGTFNTCSLTLSHLAPEKLMNAKSRLLWMVFALPVACEPASNGALDPYARRRDVAVETTPLGSSPILPQAFVDTAMPSQAGQTITVNAGGSFQAALNNAQLGDTIVLQAGAVFQGPFTLPAKTGAGWIVIRGSGALPAPGVRVVPATHAADMPKLQASKAAVLAPSGSHHYRFIGVEMRPTPGSYSYNVGLIGDNSQTSLADLPHHIIFDRCYIHGDAAEGARRALALNGAHMAVIDSHLSDAKEVGADSQAIGVWAGPGPFKIVNNYLEGAGENVMFGGSVPRIPGVVPSDIEFRGNHVRKPLSWRIGDPSYAGKPWTVKNSFELKSARRALIDRNIFDYSWGHAQTGFAIVFTVRNSDSGSTAVVDDITFTNNIIRHAASGFTGHGYEAIPTPRSQRWLIRNNLFDDINGDRWNGDGRAFQLIRGPSDVVIEHNTVVGANKVALMLAGDSGVGFVFRNNIIAHGLYGVAGDGIGSGNVAIDTYMPGAVFQRNVFYGNAGVAGQYPPDNVFVASEGDVGFVSPGSGNYALTSSSPYRNAATDGKDIGVSMAELLSSGPPTKPPATPTNLSGQ
jgi:hypothetical protein